MKTNRDIKCLAALGLAACFSPSGLAQHAGMVRLARISYVTGSASWRPATSVGWSRAVSNVPIRQGGQFWAPGKARAELMFDDGSAFRMTDGGYCTLSNLYSDSSGEFTDMKLTGGASYLRIRHPYSVYQFDTPYVAVRAVGPAAMQVWNGSNVQVCCTEGTIQCDSPAGKYTLNRGEDMVFGPGKSAYRGSLPARDSWDDWNNQRDAVVFHEDANMPTNVGLVAGELDSYGSWRDVPKYGHVWYPRHAHGWRPYHDGRWTYVDPVGWTWVANEPWGWAPYHYGTWVASGDDWGWVPGPVNQYWSPAVVSFSNYNGYTAWCPLAPAEVEYPSSLSVGFGGGNWGLYFSIGGVADYCPSSESVCVGRPFDPYWVNSFGWRGPGFYASVGIGSYFGGGPRFVPVNSYAVAGVSYVGGAGFAGSGVYLSAGLNGGTFFRNGRVFAPRGQGMLRATPFQARPTPVAFTPNRSINRDPGIPHNVLARNAFHATNWNGVGRPASAAPTRGMAAHRTTGARPAGSFGASRPGAARRLADRAPANAELARQAAAARSSLRYNNHAGAAAMTAARRQAANHNAQTNRVTANRNEQANRTAANRRAQANRTAENRNAQTKRAATTRTAANRAAQRSRAVVNRHAQSNRTAATRRAATAHRANTRTAGRSAGTRRPSSMRAAPARQSGRALRYSAPARRSSVRTLQPPRRSSAPSRSFSAPRPSARRSSSPRMSAPRPSPSRGGGNRRRG